MPWQLLLLLLAMAVCNESLLCGPLKTVSPSSSQCILCVCVLQSSSATSMDAVMEVLSKQSADRSPEDIGKQKPHPLI